MEAQVLFLGVSLWWRLVGVGGVLGTDGYWGPVPMINCGLHSSQTLPLLFPRFPPLLRLPTPFAEHVSLRRSRTRPPQCRAPAWD